MVTDLVNIFQTADLLNQVNVSFEFKHSCLNLQLIPFQEYIMPIDSWFLNVWNAVKDSLRFNLILPLTNMPISSLNAKGVSL